MDMSKTIAPKSDQLNADDLITGPRDITITGVRGMSEKDQPVAVDFEGDNGKPFKPCKSMRRVMVHCWGVDAKAYAGRSMRLYLDPKVKFGGIAVGGIRISHMSHIDKRHTMALTSSKARRSPYSVEPMQIEEPKRQSDETTATETLTDEDLNVLFLRAKSTAAGGTEQYKVWFMARTKSEKEALQNTQEPDRDDFDKVKSIHEAAKGVAAEADEQS